MYFRAHWQVTASILRQKPSCVIPLLWNKKFICFKLKSWLSDDNCFQVVQIDFILRCLSLIHYGRKTVSFQNEETAKLAILKQLSNHTNISSNVWKPICTLTEMIFRLLPGWQTLHFSQYKRKWLIQLGMFLHMCKQWQVVINISKVVSNKVCIHRVPLRFKCFQTECHGKI